MQLSTASTASTAQTTQDYIHRPYYLHLLDQIALIS